MQTSIVFKDSVRPRFKYIVIDFPNSLLKITMTKKREAMCNRESGQFARLQPI